MNAKRLNQSPYHRTMSDGSKLWEARVRFPDGTRRAFGLFKLKRQAQGAMDAAWEDWHDTDPNPESVGGYADTWTQRHPRSERTNQTNDHRVSRVLDIKVEGKPFREWMMRGLKRRHVYALVDAMLTDQGRSVVGTRNLLRSLHAMFEDAITDECMDFNPVTGVKVRAGDPRATKPSRKPRVWTFAQMHHLAAVAGTLGENPNPVYGEGLCACGCGERPKGATSRFVRGHNMEQSATYMYEPMCRVLSDCMVRLGEMLALHRADVCRGCGSTSGQLANVPHLHVSRNAHNGRIAEGDTETKRHVKIVPLPPSTDAMLRRMPPRLDSPLLFPAPRGGVWTEADFYRKVWRPARAKVSGMEDARPHDFRHSAISIMRATLGETHASDIADIAGHSLATMTAIYSHGLGEAYEKVRQIIG